MHESPAFLLGAHFFGIVKGEQPLTRCGESGVQRGRGESKHPPASARAERKQPRATGARTNSKKKPALPPRATSPRHQRESQLKKNQPCALARAEPSHLTARKNIPRATSAQAILKKKPTLPQHHIKSL